MKLFSSKDGSTPLFGAQATSGSNGFSMFAQPANGLPGTGTQQLFSQSTMQPQRLGLLGGPAFAVTQDNQAAPTNFASLQQNPIGGSTLVNSQTFQAKVQPPSQQFAQPSANTLSTSIGLFPPQAQKASGSLLGGLQNSNPFSGNNSAAPQQANIEAPDQSIDDFAPLVTQIIPQTFKEYKAIFPQATEVDFADSVIQRNIDITKQNNEEIDKAVYEMEKYEFLLNRAICDCDDQIATGEAMSSLYSEQKEDIDEVIDEQVVFLNQLQDMERQITQQIKSNAKDSDKQKLINTLFAPSKPAEAPKSVGGLAGMLGQPKLDPKQQAIKDSVNRAVKLRDQIKASGQQLSTIEQKLIIQQNEREDCLKGVAYSDYRRSFDPILDAAVYIDALKYLNIEGAKIDQQ